MSVWTHVNASFRLDGLVPITQSDIEEVFGHQYLWEDMDEQPSTDNLLPMGSEGTLRLKAWINPNMDDLTRATVSVFGDLRSYFDEEELKKWFTKIVKTTDPFFLRQAVMEYDIAGCKHVLLTVEGDNKIVCHLCG